ncbi:MAG: uracil phosphoribosyltransferase [Fimbriimonadaceae bacterium]|nr:uracil phosphoribosyltransferase [Fimbriimonadaceae bacterium]QYK55549.1 MAG: uracil phosphoribosyltransferase [Fimbriimonadaceae bacterium]
MPVHVVDHPLAQHLLTGLRDKRTEPATFRRYAWVLSTLVILEATRGVPLQGHPVETPLETAEGASLKVGLAVVPVLRAGLSMLESALEIFPDVAVGYIGLERSHETAVAHSYYVKLPRLADRYTLLVDPMLATGGSASQAIALLKANGARSVAMAAIVSAPEGVARLAADHPDVDVFTAAIDRELDHRKYILPGLGDYGDRLYGTS